MAELCSLATPPVHLTILFTPTQRSVIDFPKIPMHLLFFFVCVMLSLGQYNLQIRPYIAHGESHIYWY